MKSNTVSRGNFDLSVFSSMGKRKRKCLTKRKKRSKSFHVPQEERRERKQKQLEKSQQNRKLKRQEQKTLQVPKPHLPTPLGKTRTHMSKTVKKPTRPPLSELRKLDVPSLVDQIHKERRNRTKSDSKKRKKKEKLLLTSKNLTKQRNELAVVLTQQKQIHEKEMEQKEAKIVQQEKEFKQIIKESQLKSSPVFSLKDENGHVNPETKTFVRKAVSQSHISCEQILRNTFFLSSKMFSLLQNIHLCQRQTSTGRLYAKENECVRAT